MKLSKEQSSAIFNLIQPELNSDKTKRIREIKKENKKIEEEAFEKFKRTDEYKAVMLLAKTFKGTGIDYSKKSQLQILSYWMLKPKTKSHYLSVYDERKTIEILAIDCKNLAQLKEKINSHYSLKKKLK